MCGITSSGTLGCIYAPSDEDLACNCTIYSYGCQETGTCNYIEAGCKIVDGSGGGEGGGNCRHTPPDPPRAPSVNPALLGPKGLVLAFPTS